MQKMKGWKRLGLVLIALSVLTACGQKGDLYLPEGSLVLHWLG